jgi:hypothetical protein
MTPSLSSVAQGIFLDYPQRETLAQYPTLHLKEGGRGESVLLYLYLYSRISLV